MLKSHFEKFGLAVDYEIDLPKLEAKFLELQKQLHPDKHVNDSSDAKVQAFQAVLDVNEAYQVLKSDIARAEYLMQLAGFDCSKESIRNKTNSATLGEAFEDREQLESAQTSQELDAIAESTRRIIEKCRVEFSTNYRAKKLDAALDSFITMRYKLKFLDEIQAKMKEI